MRTANDGRGEEPWEGPAAAPSPDGEATRVFSREALASDPEGARGLPRAPDEEATQQFRRGDHPGPVPSDTAGTREFARPERAGTAAAGGSGPQGADSATGVRDESGGAALTRRFVRDRPPGRGRPPRPTAPDRLGEEPRHRPEPEPGERGQRPDRPPGPRRRRRRFRLRRLVALLLVTVLALPPATWGWVWYTARQDDRVASDAIVVLGASQYNGVPSPVFEARLRHAQTLYLEGVAPVIVTVGGKQPGDNFTEAAAGRNWLVEVGVPAGQVIAVEEGSDTIQSIQAVALVFEERSWDSAILVSDPWHSLRSKQMASDHGIEAGTSPARSGPAVIERRTQLWYITRETASLWYYWIFNDSSDIRVNAA